MTTLGQTSAQTAAESTTEPAASLPTKSNTKQSILEYVLKHGQATAAELAAALSVSPQAIRRHLKELTTDGSLQYRSEQAGVGRPQHVYEIGRRGRALLPDRHGEFAVDFLDALAETAGEDSVRAVLQRQWERKAALYRQRIGEGSVRDRVEHLVRLRREEGYMAEWHAAEDGQGFLLVEFNCAIANVAESYPTVCGHELKMFGAILPDCTVERTQWLNNGEHRCGYLIRPQQVH
ncbi:iron-sulfur cluster biosynthesis transcriptional regulator SufR [Rubidibacter lacunae KORDI 51-2]|uniref:Iron-sulfur cluster biosynthesis transcriptional regulator SufR n=1 Tax=Rubidibacter lacunae KORDI 51-2 TaxID=582515 RepID=U5DSL8_9CHRO|nr:iron-sulfur cluster biosynthesis transcriptional regulator SufR [Rubidibacter lacunae]ERN42680.1 iron-sulfur cluster biosynthesis transcriptional regulator SufR [Rubidibacter lacunae KORDI 51-2]